jgi:hypothetical protein
LYRAELHGKLSSTLEESEDVLTSNVFSFFAYADRSFLARYLSQLLGQPVSIDDAQSAKVIFWPKFSDGTEADVVVEIGDFFILVEAKLGSEFGRDAADSERRQLARELAMGRNAAKGKGLQFRLWTITAESFPRASDYVFLRERAAGEWIWSNWQSIAAFLDVPDLARQPLIANDLLLLLNKKGLRRFRGFSHFALSGHVSVAGRSLFFDEATSTVRGIFVGFESAFATTDPLDVVPLEAFYKGKTNV